MKKQPLYRPLTVQLVDRSELLVKQFGTKATYVLILLSLLLVPSFWGLALSHLFK